MRSSIRPGTSAESLADLGWFVVLTFGFVAAWRASGSVVDCETWYTALVTSNTALYLGRYLRRRKFERAVPHA